MKLSAKARVYIYAILLSIQPLAVAYGFVTHDMSVLWINVLGAILNGGLALTNITPDVQKQSSTVTTTTTHVDIPVAPVAPVVVPAAPVVVTAPEAPVAAPAVLTDASVAPVAPATGEPAPFLLSGQ